MLSLRKALAFAAGAAAVNGLMMKAQPANGTPAGQPASGTTAAQPARGATSSAADRTDDSDTMACETLVRIYDLMILHPLGNLLLAVICFGVYLGKFKPQKSASWELSLLGKIILVSYGICIFIAAVESGLWCRATQCVSSPVGEVQENAGTASAGAAAAGGGAAAGGSQQNPVTCVICWNVINSDDKVCLKKCRHEFCGDCIGELVNTRKVTGNANDGHPVAYGGLNDECPLCRAPIDEVKTLRVWYTDKYLFWCYNAAKYPSLLKLMTTGNVDRTEYKDVPYSFSLQALLIHLRRWWLCVALTGFLALPGKSSDEDSSAAHSQV